MASIVKGKYACFREGVLENCFLALIQLEGCPVILAVHW
jgi:hypothetical protein